MDENIDRIIDGLEEDVNATNNLFKCLAEAEEEFLTHNHMSVKDFLNGLCKFTSLSIMGINENPSRLLVIADEFSKNLLETINIVLKIREEKRGKRK